MPIETATYINQLVPANPVSTDGVGQGDDHVRLVKQVLQNTFAAFTGAAVTATEADLNAIHGIGAGGAGSVTVGGTAQAGSLTLKGGNTGGTQPDLTLTNAGNGTATLTLGTTTVLTVNSDGSVNFGVDAKRAGYSLVPIGVILQWSGSVATIPGGWQITDGTNGTPDLRDKFIVAAGNSFSPTQTGGTAAGGTLTTSTAGSHNHGGSTSATDGAHTHNITLASAGTHNHGGATENHTLAVGELPSHTHGVGMTFSGGPGGGSGQVAGYTGANQASTVTDGGTGGNLGHSHVVDNDGAHAHTASADTQGQHGHTISSDGSHTHTVTQAYPLYYAQAFIQRIS